MSDSDAETEAVTAEDDEIPHLPDGTIAHGADWKPWMDRFLTGYRRAGIIEDGLSEGRVSRATIERYRKSVPEFAEACAYAEKHPVLAVKRRALDIAANGVQKGIYFRGELTNTEVEYDTGLIQFVLSRKLRDEFGDKLDLNVSGGVAALHLEPSEMAEKVREFLAEMLAEKKAESEQKNIES
jgi:hypothetical protein